MRVLRLALLAVYLLSFPAAAQAPDDGFDWSGFHVGGGFGQAGLGYRTMLGYTWPGFLFIPPVAVGADLGPRWGSGGIALLQVGYSAMLGDRVLVGAQIDGQFGRLSAATDTTLPLGIVSPGYAYTLNANTILTAGARVGYLIRPDTLVYGLVGLSRGRFDARLDLTNGGVPVLGQANTFSLGGAALAVGVETRIGPRTTLAVEYRTTRFARHLIMDGPMLLPGDRLQIGYNPRLDAIRVLLNLRF